MHISELAGLPKKCQGVVLFTTLIADGSGRRGSMCFIKPGDTVVQVFSDEDYESMQKHNNSVTSENEKLKLDRGPYTVVWIASWYGDVVSVCLKKCDDENYRHTVLATDLQKYIQE